jgi:hypothetical protein
MSNSSTTNRRSKTTPHALASSSSSSPAADGDAIILRGKIEKLLVSPRSKKPSFYDCYGAERNLVALVLLTRLEAPHASHVLLRHPDLIQFCRRLVAVPSAPCQQEEGRPKQEDDPPRSSSSRSPTTTAHVFYSRLVAQAFTACLAEVGAESDQETLLSEVGSLLLELLEKRASGTTTERFSALDVDVVAVLTASLPSCRDSAVIDALLLALWGRAAIVLDQDPSKAEAKWTGPSSDDGKKKEGKEPVTPDELMEATLGSILDQNSAWAIDSDEEFCGNFEMWQIQTGRIFLDHGTRLPPQGQRPSFVVPMLEWWLRRKNDHKAPKYPDVSSSPSPWPHVLLQCIQQNTEGFRDVNSDAKLASYVLKLAMACVVNVTADDNLRGQAWFSLSSLVSAVGWDWMLVAGGTGSSHISSSSALGSAAKLCAILRMASGEYKIQLNHRLYGSAATATAESRADRDSLAEECCRFLALSLEYVAQLADRIDDEDGDDENDSGEGDGKPRSDPVQASLSNAAILHVRKSLHEALICSAHYCIERTSFGTECDLCVVRLLGALLSEFDIFLECRQSDADDEHSILNAIQAVLRGVRDRGACESLLPGLLMIFASGEGDEDHAVILKPLLADYVGFFEFWWASAARQASDDFGRVNVQSIECAWNVLELWQDVVAQMGVVVEVGAIQREIVHFLTSILDRSADGLGDDSSRTVNAISSAVSSYLVLQGGVAPCEPDASAMRRAVDILQRYNVVP